MILSRSHTLLMLLLAALYWSACQHGHSEQPVHAPISPATVRDSSISKSDSNFDTLDIPLNIEYIMGQFDPATNPDFIVIDSQYAEKKGMYLRKDAYKAFVEMYEHARKDSITLQIRSATRNFYAQKTIWEAKWTGERLIEGGENLSQTTPDPKERAVKILRYSSMPGSSRHHWGTDMDLNSLENDYFLSGEGLKMYNWLRAHAGEHGFCQPYTENRPYGYFEERWHWSYMPVSAKLTAYARTNLKNEMINGFLGSETAISIDIVGHYVLGINEDCFLPAD